jgi:hypothetical protein
MCISRRAIVGVDGAIDIRVAISVIGYPCSRDPPRRAGRENLVLEMAAPISIQVGEAVTAAELAAHGLALI